MPGRTDQIPWKRISEARNLAVNFQGLLDSGELLTGTPTIVEETTGDLTLSGKKVSTAQLTILDKTVAIGEAVQFHVASGGIAAKRYKFSITTVSDASDAQTFVVIIYLDVRSDTT